MVEKTKKCYLSNSLLVFKQHSIVSLLTSMQYDDIKDRSLIAEPQIREVCRWLITAEILFAWFTG